MKKYKDKFGTLTEQTYYVTIFIKIEMKTNHFKKYHLVPGGRGCLDPCTFRFIPNGAVDTSYRFQ